MKDEFKDKMKTLLDYESEFERIFKEYQEKNPLPRDDIYHKIRAEVEAEEDAKKALLEKQRKDDLKTDIRKKMNNKLLPKMFSNVKDELEHKQHQANLLLERRKTSTQKEVNMAGKRLKPLENLEAEQRFFKESFEQLDLQLKGQVKAIINKDYKTLEKLLNHEMPKKDIAIYVADEFTRRELLDEGKQEESEQDSDLDNELYQEYWEDMPR